MNVYHEKTIALCIIYLCFYYVYVLVLYDNSLQNDFISDHK